MFRILVFLFSLSFMISCKSHEVGNKYLEAKNHPSDKLSKENVKATKKAKHDFLAQQKKNNKEINKRGGVWQKKKKKY